MKQQKICRFFGEPAQILKAHEELDEIQEAFEDYLNNQNQETLKHVLNEVLDMYNVLSGIYDANGGELDKVWSEAKNKLKITIEIIGKIPLDSKCKVESYKKIRYGGEYDR